MGEIRIPGLRPGILISPDVLGRSLESVVDRRFIAYFSTDVKSADSPSPIIPRTMERTLIIIKPDGVQRALVGDVIKRFEQRGLRLAGLKLIQIPRALAEEHYAEHKGKGFYEGTVTYMTSAPVVVMVLEGPDAVAASRATMGATNPLNAAPGTIRADFGLNISRNLVHGSDKPETAEREIKLYFQPGELLSYARAGDGWLKE
jgi:nucleoside-diphosphate kinase